MASRLLAFQNGPRRRWRFQQRFLSTETMILVLLSWGTTMRRDSSLVSLVHAWVGPTTTIGRTTTTRHGVLFAAAAGSAVVAEVHRNPFQDHRLPFVSYNLGLGQHAPVKQWSKIASTPPPPPPPPPLPLPLPLPQAISVPEEPTISSTNGALLPVVDAHSIETTTQYWTEYVSTREYPSPYRNQKRTSSNDTTSPEAHQSSVAAATGTSSLPETRKKRASHPPLIPKRITDDSVLTIRPTRRKQLDPTQTTSSSVRLSSTPFTAVAQRSMSRHQFDINTAWMEMLIHEQRHEQMENALSSTLAAINL